LSSLALSKKQLERQKSDLESKLERAVSEHKEQKGAESKVLTAVCQKTHAVIHACSTVTDVFACVQNVRQLQDTISEIRRDVCTHTRIYSHTQTQIRSSASTLSFLCVFVCSRSTEKRCYSAKSASSVRNSRRCACAACVCVCAVCVGAVWVRTVCVGAVCGVCVCGCVCVWLCVWLFLFVSNPSLVRVSVLF